MCSHVYYLPPLRKDSHHIKLANFVPLVSIKGAITHKNLQWLPKIHNSMVSSRFFPTIPCTEHQLPEAKQWADGAFSLDEPLSRLSHSVSFLRFMLAGYEFVWAVWGTVWSCVWACSNSWRFVIMDNYWCLSIYVHGVVVILRTRKTTSWGARRAGYHCIIHCVPDFRPVFCWCFWGWDTERGPEASKPKDAFLHTSWLCNGRPQSHASLGVWASHAVAGSTKPFGAIDRCCRCGIPGWDLPADSEIDTGRLINVELLERGASMTLFMTHCRSGQMPH